VLTRKGVTAWRHALTDLTDLTDRAAARLPSVPAPVPMPAAALPTSLAAELVDALAGLALAGTRPASTAVP
jgi:hypothetical protein